jgi:hypothetical protein
MPEMALSGKSIVIVKLLICALNPALNPDKPLAASRFAIKALRAYTDIDKYKLFLFGEVVI